ncbi:MAG: DUF2794 domain-containing protein [Proteobacteria bacterium]|nr:DUF2794 domain-containing protein [Pseudomonadota bacterium]
MAEVVSIEDFRPALPRKGARQGDSNPLAFDRPELDLILQIYGRKVVAGEWCDYALDFAPERASFLVMRHTGRGPDYQYQVVKWRTGRGVAGRYAVISRTGHVVRCGTRLSEVLKVFDGRPRLL